MARKIIISVIGGHEIDSRVEQIAHKVGKIIAKNGAILVCGGLNGVMKAVSRGVKEGKGLTIGLLPGTNKADANPYIDIPITTTIGFARNAMVACTADIVVALPGSHGTACEISYAMVYKRPVIDLGGWKRKGMIKAQNVAEAEKIIKQLIKKIREGSHAGAS